LAAVRALADPRHRRYPGMEFRARQHGWQP